MFFLLIPVIRNTFQNISGPRRELNGLTMFCMWKPGFDLRTIWFLDPQPPLSYEKKTTIYSKYLEAYWLLIVLANTDFKINVNRKTCCLHMAFNLLLST